MTRHAATLALGLALMASGCAAADGAGNCFVPETKLPTRAAVLERVQGQSQREIVEAAFDGAADRVQALLRTDPTLSRIHGGDFGDLLSIAVGRCDGELLQGLLAAGVDPNGPREVRAPLLLALRSKTPALAETLLRAGATANPRMASDPRPLDEAILIGSQGAVRLLLDRGADPNRRGTLGETALHVALDSHRFAIAELLIERGADPWVADDSGGTLGAAVAKGSLSREPADEQARLRLAAYVKKLGWPSPPPDWRAVKALREQGNWPPTSR